MLNSFIKPIYFKMLESYPMSEPQIMMAAKSTSPFLLNQMYIPYSKESLTLKHYKMSKGLQNQSLRFQFLLPYKHLQSSKKSWFHIQIYYICFIFCDNINCGGISRKKIGNKNNTKSLDPEKHMHLCVQ